ncbi:MAG: NupC/NupG family nucleoside CNT transporter [Bacteroidia bacterium]|nr:NupC/NupG family nucleoside CNT transporter [Bacteroidia bacterium]
MEHIGRGVLGIVVLIGIAVLFSRDRKNISWRLVLVGIGLQLVIAVLLSKVSWFVTGFGYISNGFVAVTGFAQDGARFVFGDKWMDPSNPYAGFVFAIQVLPILIFFSALTSGLYYLGILQKVVKAFAWIMARTMRLSGAESISAAGNVLLGQTEAPLLVKPYIEGMTKSEIMCLMTGGMATIAGSVLAAYVGMLGGDDPVLQQKFASHLLTASLMNAPAAIVMAKILVPETDWKSINTDLAVSNEKIGANFIDAIANGTSQGLQLALNVGAMLIAFIGIIYMVNGFLGWVGTMSLSGHSLNSLIFCSTDGAFDTFSLQYLLGQVFRYFAWIIGVEWNDTLLVGSLLGTKTIVNEFVAYSGLTALEHGAISERSVIITTYALCGFANFSSIAIQIGGLGGIAPNQRTLISKLGLLSVFGGTLAGFLTASIAGMLN